MLDGAERLLRAYSGMGAAYQGDEESKEDGEEGLHGRDCVDPIAAYLLMGLAQVRESKTLLTSRMMPRELEGRAGGLVQGVRRIELTGLDPDDATRLFRDLGVHTMRAEVVEACEPLGYHPLSLQILARYIRYDPNTPNDLRAAAGYDPTADLLGKRQHILTRAYDTLPKTVQHLLSRLAAFRGGVSGETLEAVFGGGRRIRDNLGLLERRGLLYRSVQQGKTNYDLHPIVRRYAYDRLADPADIHSQLVNYFEAVPKPAKVISLADLNPAIELYHHLVRAGRYDDAHVLFDDRLHGPMYFQLGAYRPVIELLRALFPDGEERPPRLSQKGNQIWTLNELAKNYSLLGRPEAAIPVYEKAVQMSEKAGDKRNQAICLVNLAYMAQIYIGALKAAEINLRRSIELFHKVPTRLWEGVSHGNLGWLLAHTGDWLGFAAELDIALKQFKAEKHIQMQSNVSAFRSLAALLQGNGRAGEATAQEALRLADLDAHIDYPVERDYIRVYWLLGWASMLSGNPEVAQDYLDMALRRCRAINLVELEPSILLAQARLARTIERFGKLSYECAEEARGIAERAGYRLNLADIHNFLAQLALDEGNKARAREHAQKGYDYAWCDGPPFSYAVALAEAERLLKESEQ